MTSPQVYQDLVPETERGNYSDMQVLKYSQRSMCFIDLLLQFGYRAGADSRAPQRFRSVKPDSPAPWRSAPAGRAIPPFTCACPRLLQDLNIVKGYQRYPKLINTLPRTQLLILDDWGLVKLTTEQRRDLLEILKDKINLKGKYMRKQKKILTTISPTES